jgi:hypothetical protein
MSQDNTLVITVDEANDGDTTADVQHTYERFETFNTRSVFHHSDHLPDLRKMLGFYRTPAKRSGNRRGSQKSAVKFTWDVIVPGVDGTNIVETHYIEVNSSIPLGVTSAEAKARRQHVVAVLDDDTIMDTLNIFLGI